jgi:hypothetical protein
MNTVLFSNNNKPPFDRDYWISKLDKEPSLSDLFEILNATSEFQLFSNDFFNAEVYKINKGITMPGAVWEQVLAIFMSDFTSISPRNQKGMDFENGDEAKCWGVGQHNYATLGGVKNKAGDTVKTGTLRCCIYVPKDEYTPYRLYYLLIPHSEYSSWTGDNVKLSFDPTTGKPTSMFEREDSSWGRLNKYRVSFSEVCSPIIP